MNYLKAGMWMNGALLFIVWLMAKIKPCLDSDPTFISVVRGVSIGWLFYMAVTMLAFGISIVKMWIEEARDAIKALRDGLIMGVLAIASVYLRTWLEDD